MSKYVPYDESAYQITPRKAARKAPAAGVNKRRQILAELEQPTAAALLRRARQTTALARRLMAQGIEPPDEMLLSAKRDVGNAERRQRGLRVTTARSLGIKVGQRR